MISFLLTISFLLHIISITLIYYLYKKLQQKNSTYEVVELLETYLDEIKQENEQLVKNMALKEVEQQEDDSTQQQETDNETRLENKEDINYLQNTMNVDDEIETSLQAKVLQLYHEGISVEQIAKRLNCGKTEASLIIKFHANK